MAVRIKLEHSLAAIQRLTRLNAFVSVADAARQSSDDDDVHPSPQPLRGLTFAAKDNFTTRSLPTTCCSRMLSQHRPTYDATCVRRLLEAGAALVGKTAMDEFGMGSHTATAHNQPPTCNPWSNPNQPRSAGGSSGGSAVAVAAGMCDVALGSDTGGSIRLPASYCGVVGFKPSYGRCSRHGLVAYASSLDTPGILARTVADAALATDVISGFDASDSTSLSSKPLECHSQVVMNKGTYADSCLTGVRIGVPREYYVDEMALDVSTAWDNALGWLANQGAEIVSVSLDSTQLALPTYYVLACAEASSNLSRYDGMEYGHRSGMAEQYDSFKDLYTASRTQGFGREVKRRILSGTFVLCRSTYDSYYVQAQRLRRLVANDFAATFASSCDVLVAPTSISTAPYLADVMAGRDDPTSAYANDLLTVPASLAGLPVMTVPVSLSGVGDGTMPIGLQVIGKRLDESSVVRVASALEGAASFPRLPSQRLDLWT